MATPDEAIAEILSVLHREPVFLAGSCVAAQVHGFTEFSDVDLFVPTSEVLMTTVQILLDNGATPDDRFDRVWHRWKRYGTKNWHTQSMKLTTKHGTPVNVVFKMVDGHPTTSLAQVLESFDFGLLGAGYDIEQNRFKDMRPYLFPGLDVNGPLPLMPNKRDNWVNGFVSQYNGLREGLRYLKYTDYGYDMSSVAPDLVQGYLIASSYHADSFDKNKQALGEIYSRIAEAIDTHDLPELRGLYEVLDFSSPLDEILERLE